VLPLKARVVGLVVNEVDVAPGIGVAPSTDRRRVTEPVNDHCTATYPVAAAVKVAVAPRDTDTDMGWRVTVGATVESYHTARPLKLLPKIGSPKNTAAASLEIAAEAAPSEMVAIVEPEVAEAMVVDEEPERATVDPSGVMAAAVYEPLIMIGVESDNEPIELTNE